MTTETAAGEALSPVSRWRQRDPGATLAAARHLGEHYRVTRVFDITWLDRLGIPVYAAVRPEALTVCVTGGKGLVPVEAEVGALLEAVELAFAEDLQGVPLDWLSPAEYRRRWGVAVSDFAPIAGYAIPADQEIAFCRGEAPLRGGEHPIPAELVFHTTTHLGPEFLGSNSTGLASGNSVLEASIHALSEVLERDIQSFQALSDTSALVVPSSLPAPLTELRRRIRQAGLECWLRAVSNPYGVPYFSCLLLEPDETDPMLANGGYGAHPDAAVAAFKAILEAVQSRLCIIHGGRDDLLAMRRHFDSLGRAGRARYLDTLRRKGASSVRRTSFDEITPRPRSSDLEEVWKDLLSCVEESELGPVLRFVYTPQTSAIQVVRVAIAGAENFTRLTRKVGPRLAACLRRQRTAS